MKKLIASVLTASVATFGFVKPSLADDLIPLTNSMQKYYVEHDIPINVSRAWYTKSLHKFELSMDTKMHGTYEYAIGEIYCDSGKWRITSQNSQGAADYVAKTMKVFCGEANKNGL